MLFRSTAEGVAIGIKLSHQDMASMIGSTRETVTVILGELQTERLLFIKRRQIILRNPNLLAESIGLLPPEIPSTDTPGNPALRQTQFGS